MHLLGVTEHGGRLLDHLEVDVKHNETSHFTALLQPLDLDGAVVTFDAPHTVRANLDWLTGQKKAHYIAVVALRFWWPPIPSPAFPRSGYLADTAAQGARAPSCPCVLGACWSRSERKRSGFIFAPTET